MSLSVINWIDNTQPQRKALVELNNVTMEIWVCFDGKHTLEDYKNVNVELDYDEIIRIEKVVSTKDKTGIFNENVNHKIIGYVHQVTEIPGGKLYDLYMQPGPDFISIDSNDVNITDLRVGDYVLVYVKSLCCFPTWT